MKEEEGGEKLGIIRTLIMVEEDRGMGGGEEM